MGSRVCRCKTPASAATRRGSNPWEKSTRPMERANSTPSHVIRFTKSGWIRCAPQCPGSNTWSHFPPTGIPESQLLSQNTGGGGLPSCSTSLPRLRPHLVWCLGVPARGSDPANCRRFDRLSNRPFRPLSPGRSPVVISRSGLACAHGRGILPRNPVWEAQATRPAWFGPGAFARTTFCGKEGVCQRSCESSQRLRLHPLDKQRPMIVAQEDFCVTYPTRAWSLYAFQEPPTQGAAAISLPMSNAQQTLGSRRHLRFGSGRAAPSCCMQQGPSNPAIGPIMPQSLQGFLPAPKFATVVEHDGKDGLHLSGPAIPQRAELDGDPPRRRNQFSITFMMK